AIIIGGIILAIGVMSSAAMTTLIGLVITYGLLFGIGIGICYVCPIATAQKWYPDKKGLISGIAVAGFGAGAFIFNYVISALAVLSIPLMFIILGVIYSVMILGGAFTLKLPPAGYRPPGWTPPPPTAGVSSGIDLTRNETVKTRAFWLLWLMFTLSAISGLLVIGSFAAFAKLTDAFDTPLYVISGTDFVLLGGIAALFNGLGRIAWGKIADMTSYKKTMLMMFTIQGVLMIVYFFTNISIPAFMALTCLIYFCFGGNFSLFPTATTDLFGLKNIGANYGVVFSAYGIAGFIGATMVPTFYAFFGSYLILFITMGIMSFASTALTLIIKPPKPKTPVK
ncbi:MAG: MFS transporter, partial [Candidatus Odinarchaeota archaeon]